MKIRLTLSKKVQRKKNKDLAKTQVPNNKAKQIFNRQKKQNTNFHVIKVMKQTNDRDISINSYTQRTGRIFNLYKF